MTISIHQNKAEVLVDMVQNFVSREKVTLQEMQSLVGTLDFFCKAITSTWHPLGKCMTLCVECSNRNIILDYQLVVRVTLTCG